MKSKNNVISVIIAIAILLVVVGTVLAVTRISNNIKEEKAEVVEDQTESKASEIVLEDNKYMHVEIDASGDKVPVPNGYVGSRATGEYEIDTGYVIYELNEGESKDTLEINDTNKDEAQKTRNQYVWVPVPDTSKFYGTDANGKKWGKIYNFTTGTSTDNTFDEVTGTYAYNWREIDGIMSVLGFYREPDVLEDYDRDSRLHILGLGVETTHEFLMQLEKEFNKMIDSVEKYGGFYIGRYETGNLEEEQAVVRKGNTDIGNQNWYTMYKKCKELEKNNINVTTGMIWGNQWDRTLMWLIESGAKTKEEVIDDSTSWGNYSDSTFEYVNSSGNTVTKLEDNPIRIPTGSSDYTKANNIYDLAGNTSDWTMESYYAYTSDRVICGGYCWYSGVAYSASTHNASNGPFNVSYIIGCRATLYIK